MWDMEEVRESVPAEALNRVGEEGFQFDSWLPGIEFPSSYRKNGRRLSAPPGHGQMGRGLWQLCL